MIKILSLFCITGMCLICLACTTKEIILLEQHTYKEVISLEQHTHETIQYIDNSQEITNKVLVVDPNLLQKSKPVMIPETEDIILRDIVVTTERQAENVPWKKHWAFWVWVLIFVPLVIVWVLVALIRKK